MSGNVGLLDLPSPWLQRVDDALAPLLTPAGCLVMWAVLAAVASLELYRLVSPQQRVKALTAQANTARRALAGFDGDMGEAWPLLRENLALPFKRLAVVLPATLLAALPVLILIAHLSRHYAYEFPPEGQAPDIYVAAPFQAQWQTPPRQVEVRGPGGELVLRARVAAPSPVLHPPQWWNGLLANPGGYLPDDSPVARIVLDLPKQQFVPVGPSWLQGWEALFFSVLLLAALSYKRLRGIA